MEPLDPKTTNRTLLFQAVQQLGTKLAELEKTLETWGQYIGNANVAIMGVDVVYDQIKDIDVRLKTLEQKVDALVSATIPKNG